MRRDRRPNKTPGHATYCDCGECMADGGAAQRLRRYGDPCMIPISISPGGWVYHTEPTCEWYGKRVWVGPGGTG